MSNEEAILVLQNDAYILYEDDMPYDRQAYDLAIKALEEKEIKTNADRIRSMTDEELAEYFMPDYYDGPKFYCPVQPVIGEGECAMRSDCRQCLLDWLREEGET